MTKTPEKLAEEWANAESDLWFADISTYTDGHKSAVKQAFLAGYKAAQQWISVKDRLPEINEDVLISYGITPFYHLAFLTHNGDIKWFIGSYSNVEYQLEDITYWMPLPKPPEEEA